MQGGTGMRFNAPLFGVPKLSNPGRLVRIAVLDSKALQGGTRHRVSMNAPLFLGVPIALQ